MKLQDVRFAGERLIEAYGEGGFRFTDGRREGSLMILPREIRDLPFDRFDAIDKQAFGPLFEAKDDIELVLIGTGLRQQFPDAELRKRFIEHNLPLEVMDTGAACRTYNILVSEDRRVAAVLIAV